MNSKEVIWGTYSKICSVLNVSSRDLNMSRIDFKDDKLSFEMDKINDVIGKFESLITTVKQKGK